MLIPSVLQLQTGVNIVKNEGFLALYSGLGPAIGRGLFYGGEFMQKTAHYSTAIHCWLPCQTDLGMMCDCA